MTESLLKSPRLVSVFWPSLSNVVVWIVSTCPPISKSSRPFNNPFVTVPNAPINNWHNRYFHVPQLFYFSSKGRITYLFFHFPSDLFCGPPGQQSRQFCRFSFFLFFFVDYYKVWSSSRD